MKKFYLSVTLDGILCAFIYFLLTFIILNYFTERAVSLVLSITLSLVLTLFTVKLLSEKRQKSGINNSESKLKDKIITQLNFMTKSQANNIFIKAFNRQGIATEKRRDGIFLPDKKTLVFIKFGYQQLSKADVVKIYNSIKKNESAEVYAEAFQPEIKEFTSRFVKIRLFDGDKAYTLLKNGECLSEINCTVPEIKSTKNNLTLNVFNKKRAKTFFGFGIFFLLSSFFVPIKIYYVICGCLMLIISLICVFFGKRTENND
ncbi:MAG: hypothetical protein IJW47_02085 [Clostridia bacterium]|nr:hypothetical protein [Clostridia bacterium]